MNRFRLQAFLQNPKLWRPFSVDPSKQILREAFSKCSFSPCLLAKSSRLAGVASLLLLTGCASLQVRLGWKVNLDRTPVASITASLPSGQGIAPGEKKALVVSVMEPDGTVLQTEGSSGGKVMWKDLKVVATVATFNQEGTLRLSRDPRISDGKVPHVSITVPSHPDVHAELDIPVRYNFSFISNFLGSPGSSGLNGIDGLSGSSGSMGSIDPNNPSPGGNGSDGSDGTNGQDGSPGYDGPPVQIRVALRAGSHHLLQVAVSAQGRERFFLVDPLGGSLTVNDYGGSGGSGGRGGRGGSGGSGGIGIPNGMSGQSGSDGRNGSDGAQGRGGIITMTYDPLARPYLGAIRLFSRNGPSPRLNEAPVPPLW